MKKEDRIAIIQEAVGSSQEFGNKIVDISDAWRDAISERLRRMSAKEIKVLAEEAGTILKGSLAQETDDEEGRSQ